MYAQIGVLMCSVSNYPTKDGVTMIYHLKVFTFNWEHKWGK